MSEFTRLYPNSIIKKKKARQKERKKLNEQADTQRARSIMICRNSIVVHRQFTGSKITRHIIYNMMVIESELLPDKVNWVSLLRHLLMSLNCYQVWLNHGVGDCNRFLMNLKQRLTENSIQNWRSRLYSSTRATFYKYIAVFQLQPYFD